MRSSAALALALLITIATVLITAWAQAPVTAQQARSSSDPAAVAEVLLNNTQREPVPTGFQMPIAICNGTPPVLPYSYIVNVTLYDIIDPNGSNVYFASSSGAASPNLYSWYEGTVSYPGAYCHVWWVKLPNGVPANGSTTIYMYVGGPPANYYAEFYPYVGTNAQVLGTMRYDNGQDVFIAYGYFNDTLDGWSAYVYAGPFTPNATTRGIEMLNDTNGEGTYVLPPAYVPKEPVVVEEAWYESGGANSNVIALFGDPLAITTAASIGGNGGETPTDAESTFAQFKYYSNNCGGEAGLFLKSAVLDQTLTSASFPTSAGTFYSWLFVNSSYAEAGYAERSASYTWVPLAYLGTLAYTKEVGSKLSYNPFQYPTVFIGAGSGYNGIYGCLNGPPESYQYVEWVVVRLWPPDGVYPSESLVSPTSTTLTTTSTTSSATTVTVTRTVTSTVTSTTTATQTVTSTTTSTSTTTITQTMTSTTTSTVTQTATTTVPVTTTVTTTVINTTTTTVTQTVPATTATSTVTSTVTQTYTSTATVTSTTTVASATATVTQTVTSTVPMPVTTTVTSTVTSATTSTVTTQVLVPAPTTTYVTVTLTHYIPMSTTLTSTVVVGSPSAGTYAAIGAAVLTAAVGLAAAVVIGRR